TNGGYEYNLVLGVAALTVAFTGPGSLSIDALLHYSLGSMTWGIAAAIVAVLRALGPLAPPPPPPPPTTTPDSKTSIVVAVTAFYDLMFDLEDSCPITFSIEIGNERTRVPVA